ncbi:trypsin-1-like [Phlebotomus papatasi]|uniref:trypsin-1-like n=1 Tax=Phlebotomus papatasi TaxID=29031 RepID=UPI00248341E5|nr:trypsin-1-like [Phlebotomus papatasi]
MEFIKFFLVVAIALVLAKSVTSSNPKSLLDYQREYTGNFSHPKIINGKPADEKEFPYFVGIIEFNPFLIFARCGGAIIHPKWVLTSGFCVEDSQIADSVVFLLEMGSIVSGAPRVEYILTSSSVFLHPGFDSDTMDNDIALLSLPSSVPNDEYVRPVALAAEDTSKESLVGQFITIAGFGATSDDGTLPEILQEGNTAQIPIISDIACEISSNGYQLPTSPIFCSRGNSGRSAPAMCIGDSGAPATVMMNGVPTLVGIGSAILGSGCGNSPQIYTYIPEFCPWIDEIIANN